MSLGPTRLAYSPPMATDRPPDSPYLVVTGGLFLSFIAGFAAFIAQEGGVGDGAKAALTLGAGLVGLLGAVMLGVGVVAAGVRLGHRHVEHERRQG